MGSEHAGDNDAVLIKAFRQGDEKAFDRLIERHMHKAVQIAALVTGNYEDAKDVSQEAFVKVHPPLKGFKGESKFSTWFYRILMNTAKDFLRKRKWNRFMKWESQESMGNFFEAVEDTGQASDKSVLREEMGKKITTAIQSLPYKQQWVVTLRFVEGCSLQEISEVTGSPLGTVKATLHVAVGKLKGALGHLMVEGGV